MNQKLLIRITLSFCLIGLVSISSVLILKNYNATSFPVEDIYGEWVEQDVAPYLAESFEIRKKGIYKNGAALTNHYQFRGDKLKYSVGEVDYVFLVIDPYFMKSEKPHHYKARFKKVRYE